MASPRLGGENRIGRRVSQREECEALGSFLLPCAVTRVSLLAVSCLSGATPRGQRWTSTVTLPQRRNGLRAWRMAVLSTFRELSLCRQVHRELMRSTLLDLTPLMPATACHQRNEVEKVIGLIITFINMIYTSRKNYNLCFSHSCSHNCMARNALHLGVGVTTARA